jgi:anaerobic ribonucleoside-triphosphate reductase activating protein
MFVHGKGGVVVEARALAEQIIATPGIEGISVLGGEPFEQASDVFEVATRVRAAGLSVMVYSGFTLAELLAKNDAAVTALLGEIDLLVDGRFEQTLPEARRRWLGSRNQVMHFLTPRYSPDDPCFTAPNTVELRFEDGRLTINGWPEAADVLTKNRRTP